MGEDRFSDFLSFKLLISTTWIKTVYVIGAILITIGSLMTLVTLGRVDGGLALFTALIYFVALNVAWRVACEFLILFFSMHEQLVTIARNTATQTSLSSGGVARVAGAAPAPRPAMPETSETFVGIPASVGAAYDRWVAGEVGTLAYDEFIRDLGASLPVLPERISAAFLQNRFRAAVGTPAFDSLIAGRR